MTEGKDLHSIELMMNDLLFGIGRLLSCVLQYSIHFFWFSKNKNWRGEWVM